MIFSLINNFRLKNFRFRENQFISTKSGSSVVLAAAGFFFLNFYKLLAAIRAMSLASLVKFGHENRLFGGMLRSR